MATLRVERTDPRDTRLRQVHIYLDGKHLGTLGFGESLEAHVPPGRHSLRAYNTLVGKAVTFDAESSETRMFVTGNKRLGCLFALAASMGIGLMGVFLEPK